MPATRVAMGGVKPVALITGAAGGLGGAIAHSLAKQGFELLLNDLEASPALTDLCGAVRALGARSEPLPQDISRVDQLPTFIDRAHAIFGRLDCLVNNAGVSVLSRGDLLDVSPESFDRCMSVNLRAQFFLTQAVAKRLLQLPRAEPVGRAKPCIITITTVAVDEIIGKVLSEYSIAKAGLSHMVKHFAVRLAPLGIDCFEVRPGMMKTSMTQSSRGKYDALINGGFVPALRWGEVEEIGQAVASLASGALPYAVGQVISIDGGMRLKVF
jgi:NAD(P)-dependent dehydrogenase (short-subunit alcohol dehydrogenase family)